MNECNIEAEKYLKCVRYRKLLNQVLYVIRKSIISYSTENATQKIWEVQGVSIFT